MSSMLTLLRRQARSRRIAAVQILVLFYRRAFRRKWTSQTLEITKLVGRINVSMMRLGVQ